MWKTLWMNQTNWFHSCDAKASCPNPSWKNATTAERSSASVWDSVRGREREVESISFRILPPVCTRQKWVGLYQHHHTLHRHWGPTSDLTNCEAYTLCPPPVGGRPGSRDAQPGCYSAISESLGQPYRAGEKEGRWHKILCGLQKIEQLHQKRRISATQNWRHPGLAISICVLHHTRSGLGGIGKWEWTRGHKRRWHLQPILAYTSSTWCHSNSVMHQRRFRDWWRPFWPGSWILLRCEAMWFLYKK